MNAKFNVQDVCFSLDGFPVVTIDDSKFKVKQLLQPGDANTKLRKSAGRGFETIGLSLAPHKSAGRGNVCPGASAGCIKACLNHQGLASVFIDIQKSRIAKTLAFYNYRGWFLEKLTAEISEAEKSADKRNDRLACRLNVFSDLRWEKLGIVKSFPDVEFYDYTKIVSRAGAQTENYWLTLSRSEKNDADCIAALGRGLNVAVVFADMSDSFTSKRNYLQKLPKTWRGFKVSDGDDTDLRFTDPRGKTRGNVIGLRLKTHSNAERAAAIASGFPVQC